MFLRSIPRMRRRKLKLRRRAAADAEEEAAAVEGAAQRPLPQRAHPCRTPVQEPDLAAAEVVADADWAPQPAPRRALSCASRRAPTICCSPARSAAAKRWPIEPSR